MKDKSMTEDNTTEGLPEGEDGFNPIELLMAASRDRNSKPDTAQGVADLMDRSFEFARTNGMSDMGVIEDPETGVLLNVVCQPGGNISFSLQEQIDARRPNPRARRGTATLTALDSFIAHVNRFGDDDSAVFADESRSSPSVLAVLDYHRKDTLAVEGEEATGSMTHGEYRHGKHRSRFDFPLSDEWQAWHEGDKTPMNMASFAIFLENNVLDIAEITKAPAGTERFVDQNGGLGNIADWQMLTKLARGLRIDENSTVSEAVTLASGEGELTISNTHDTEVGGVKVKVPTMFFIEIPIFREGVFYRLPVRLRYRKDRGGVTFWYEIWRSDRSFMDAFNEAIDRIRAETPAQVFYGKPEA
jgi:hypothetical protein